VEPLWPFVAGEFAFECAAWPALEMFLVDQVVAWMKKWVRMAIPSVRGLLRFSRYSKDIRPQMKYGIFMGREGFLRALKFVVPTMI
jgi:hypothetical protein